MRCCKATDVAQESTAIRGKKAYTELSTKAAGVTFTTKFVPRVISRHTDVR